MFPIGGDRVGIVGVTEDTGTRTDLFEPTETGETVAWVDGCLFEIQSSAEDQTIATTTSATQADCFMPVLGLEVPATLNGSSVTLTAATITASKALRFNGVDYAVRGDAVVEQDIHGVPNHLFAQCERQRG